MNIYEFCLILGAVGLVVMALSGLSHLGHHGSGSHAGHGHAGHGHAGHGHAGAVHSGHAGHVAHGHSTAPGESHGGSHTPVHSGSHALLSLLSPRVAFALLVGFGAGGLVAAPLAEPWRAVAALISAGAFEGLLVGPVWRTLFRFESAPALTLESTLEDYARSVMDFDANGQGLVALEVDGQIVQLLATLAATDRARGVRVRTGDLVRVSSIDPTRNQCIVRLRES